MLLPFPFDSVVEWLGRATAKLRRWAPEGQRVVLVLVPSSDNLIAGRYAGTITELYKGPHSFTGVANELAIIRLDSPLSVRDRMVQNIAVSKRYMGHGFYRLLVASCFVNCYVKPFQAPDDSMEAIGRGKLTIDAG